MKTDNYERTASKLDVSIDKFIDKLIVEKGFNSANPDQKQKLHEMLKEKLIDHINQSVLYQLPDDALQTINNLLDEKNPSIDKIIEVAKMYNLDIKSIYKKAVSQFHDIFIGLQIKGKA